MRVYAADSAEASLARPLARPGVVVDAPQVVDRLAVLEELERLAIARAARAEQDGRQAGYAEVTRHCACLVVRAERAVQQRLTDLSSEVAELAIAIAGRVLEAVAEAQPSTLSELVRQQVRALAGGAIRLYAGTRAHDVLSRHWATSPPESPVELELDADAQPWALRLEGGGSVIEAGFERQLETIAQTLLSPDLG